MTGQTDLFFKLLVVGESGVGKTCLLLRFVDNEFSETHMPSIGVDFKMKTLMLEDRPVKLQIWDTAGQERFHTLTESYYRNSHGVILVYDVTDRTSFDRIQKWAGQIDAYENLRLSKLLVGNKTDLAEKRMVTTAEGQELAQTLGMAFVETSAKSTDNVEQAFVGIATEILHNIEKGIVTSPTTTTGRVSLVAANPAACRDASESTERSCCRS